MPFLSMIQDWVMTNIVLVLSIIIILFVALTVFTVIRFNVLRKTRQLLYQDSLTGVKKILHLEKNFNNILVDFDRDVAMYYINIDNFKNYNDIFGFQVANKILEKFAERIQSQVNHDHVYRVHSDRFIILNPIDSSSRDTFIETLIDALKQPFYIDKQDINLTVSVGRYDISEANPRYHDVILAAELALDRAKTHGKDQMVLYTGDLKQAHKNAFDMFYFLKTALQDETFHLEFQPIIHTQSKTLAGFESLLRFDDKRRIFFPSEIIYYAEKFNMIEALDRLVVKKSLEAYQVLKKEAINFDFMSINISSRQIHNASFVTFMKQMIETYNIKPQTIVIEFTETLDPEGLDKESKFIDELRALGLKIAIDDFGSGYSSMLRLSRNALDRIKIDKSFVTDLMHSKRNQALIKAMVNLGHAFDLEVIVEGVENEEEYRFAKSLSIGFVQGYYFYKPLKLSTVIETFKNG